MWVDGELLSAFSLGIETLRVEYRNLRREEQEPSLTTKMLFSQTSILIKLTMDEDVYSKVVV